MTIYTAIHDTPVGLMRLGATEQGICMFDFVHRKNAAAITTRIAQEGSMQEGHHPYFDRLLQQLDEYATGQRTAFDLPLHLLGSEFQKRVWNALLAIPYGATRTYKQQSIALGDLKAIRAVAKANGDNSIAVIIPCHRVIGSAGELTGYAGGIPTKQRLLDLERRYSGAPGQTVMFS